MFLTDLFEAPIDNFEVHDMDRPGTFPETDRKLLSSPSHVEKIRKKFAKTPYVFDLYFVNQRGENKYVTNDKFTDKFRDDLMDIHGETTPEIVHWITGLEINPKPGAITIVLLSNANSVDSISITPWIVAHRIGHAFSDSAVPSLNKHPQFSMMSPLETMRALNTMRSARTRQMQAGEHWPEMIAQYILNGTVIYRMPDEAYRLDISPAREQEIKDWFATINAEIKVMLDDAVGKIFITV